MFGGVSKARGERFRLKSRYWLSWGLSVVAIGSIATGALVFDALTPEIISVGFFYVALVLLGFWFLQPKATLALAVLATFLAVGGRRISIPDNVPQWQGWLNRALAVCTIWLAAVFGWRIRSLENELQVTIDLADSLSPRDQPSRRQPPAIGGFSLETPGGGQLQRSVPARPRAGGLTSKDDWTD